MSLPYPIHVNLLDSAITTITTLSSVGATFPGAVDVSARQKLSIQFTAASVTSGNGVFTVWVSNDGVTFIKYQRLTDNLTNTNAQTDTRVSSVTLSSNGSKIYFFPEGDYFKYIMACVTRTTDGTYSATLMEG